MAESAEQIHDRLATALDGTGRLPRSLSTDWDIFPWEVVDGELAPKRLGAPADEPLRAGDPGGRPCHCQEDFDPARVVWEDDNWLLTHPGAPSGLPMVLTLLTRDHLDFGELDEERASEFGRISNRLVRIMESVENVGRVHMSRWGDGGSHFHVWFFARTARLSGVLGSPALEWDDILPATPQEVWREDLHTVATKLANSGGTARF